MENFICKYCNKKFVSLRSLRGHERLCKENPNRKISPFVQYNKSENKKLTGQSNQYTKAKREGYKVIISEESHIKRSENSKRLKMSDIAKHKISVARKKYLEEHPDKIPFKLNHSSKKSYPEQYFEELFEKENIPLYYHKQVGRYELDFYNEDLMKYVEIDGEQHYQPHMIKHDKERTEYLENLGWKGIRIRWSEYKKSNNKEIFILEIKNFLNMVYV